MNSERYKMQPLANAFVSGTTVPVARLIRETKLDPTAAIVSINSFGTRFL